MLVLNIPIIDRLTKSKEKRDIENRIRQLTEQKARLKTELETLQDMDRDTDEIKEELREVDKKLMERYDELANLEYKQTLSELSEESEERIKSLSRMKGEFKQAKKDKKKLKEKLEEKDSTIEKLKEDKKGLAKKINELEEEVRDKEMRIEQKEAVIKDLKGEYESSDTEKPSEDTKEQETPNERLLKSIIDRYSEEIDEKEKKTIQEMKQLIQPNNINLREYLKGIEGENPLEECRKAYEKIMKEIDLCKPPKVEYWMDIKSALDHKVADHKAKAILLCSAFRHFDEEAYVAVVKLKNGEKRHLIELRTNEKMLLVDPNHKQPFKKYYGNRDEVMDQYKYKGDEIKNFQYIFNDRKYIDMRET